MKRPDNLKNFINKNINLAVYKKGRWGTSHWEIISEKGDYQKRINADTREEAIKQYYYKYCGTIKCSRDNPICDKCYRQLSPDELNIQRSNP